MKISVQANRIILALTLAGLIFLQSCQNIDSNGKIEEADVFQKINDYLDMEEQNGFSGLISVKIKDQPVYNRSFGYANREEQTPINKNTVFDIGSLTKQFTAAAILKLEMDGKLTVNDSLSKFFPDIPEEKANITLHQLLTHTSGLKKMVGNDYRRCSKEEFIDRVFKSDLDTLPGTHYNYSHAGYSLLGTIIEQASGMAYENYLNEKLFKPVGMTNTGYVMPRWEEDQIAHGYRRCRDWGKPMDMPWASDGPYWNLRANGGLLSSSPDLFNWLSAIEGNKILSSEAREKLFHPHVKEGEDAGSFYSYGWVILKSTRGTDVIGNRGDNRRFYADILKYKTEDVTILLLSNLDKPGNGNITTQIARIIFWPDYGPEVQGSIQQCLDSLPENRMGEVAGDFLRMLGTTDEVKSTDEFKGFFSDYLINKHTPDYILGAINNLKSKHKNISIRKIVITDYQVMDLYLSYKEGNDKKNLYLKLVFDEEEGYLIRSLEYYSRNS